LNLTVELTGAQELRLLVLDYVRRMCAGEDVPVDEQLAMCEWVIDKDPKMALRLEHEKTKLHAADGFQVRYAAAEDYQPTDLRRVQR